MLQKLKSISDQNSPHLLHYIYARSIKTMKNTTKADKYARLFANMIKLLRTVTPENKQKYAKFYKQLLTLRQVFRWHGLYQGVLQIKNKGRDMFKLSNINNLSFILFQIFADTLDRSMFYMQLLDLNQSKKQVFSRIQQMESDCYFIGCLIWLLYHIRTFRKVWKQESYQNKKIKIMKIIKYALDCLTSYCKFSKRVWELSPKTAAIVGIVSSIIGLYQLML